MRRVQSKTSNEKSRAFERAACAPGIRALRVIISIAFLIALIALVTPSPTSARLPYSRSEDKKCYYCHADWENDKKVLTPQGEYYLANGFSLAGLPEELAAGPPEPPVEEEEEAKGPPFGVILGMLVFLAMIVMIVVSVIRAPAKEVEKAKIEPGEDE